MALTKQDENKIVRRVYGWLCLVVGVVLLVVGAVAWVVGSTTVSMIDQSLTAEKAYFPAAGSPGFTPAAFPAAQKNAGKQVVDGPSALDYANDYVNVQMKLVGGGKTAAEITNEAVANPTNAGLQQLQGVMFQLDATHGSLLSAYGSWAQGMMMVYAGMAMAAAGVVLVLLGGAKLMMYLRG
jgi:hypothetical protein